jgi:hypothetical protein
MELLKVLLIEFVPLEKENLKFGVNTKRNKSENSDFQLYQNG